MIYLLNALHNVDVYITIAEFNESFQRKGIFLLKSSQSVLGNTEAPLPAHLTKTLLEVPVDNRNFFFLTSGSQILIMSPIFLH